MKIGELAQRTGVTRDALRFYERLGLIESDRQGNGYRDYAETTHDLVMAIKTAQSLGFSLAEIADQHKRLKSTEDPDAHISQALRDKQAFVDKQMTILGRLRDELAQRATQSCPLRRLNAKPCQKTDEKIFQEEAFQQKRPRA